ncbi:MAG: DUF1643 domain-containing protein [Nanoarchaeota archaeon]|nr:DUF1643 domain-containing protein [Nanoarchaeota archaeon]MBU1052114.1 DUF1643 domain-containing protein [Nanoarchaeota archaeon]MBU1988323.1 DUF1643 domain-containing protein [Nanoarchaeota archaeon]
MIRTFEKEGVYSEALFSECEKYRYKLKRKWDNNLPQIMFIGLNPSTADEIKNDPTVSRMINYAKQWGYGSVSVCNVFAFRATFPKDLKNTKELVGRENDKSITEEAQSSEKIVIAWGNHALFMNRNIEMMSLLHKHELFCIGVNKNGEPKHVLYLKKDLSPELFSET